jgi:hypothetical protein
MENTDPYHQLLNSNVLIAIGITAHDDASIVAKIFQARRLLPLEQTRHQCQFTLDCARPLPAMVSVYDASNPFGGIMFPWTNLASAQRLYVKMSSLFERWTSDDFVHAILIFVHQNCCNGQSIDWVKYSIDATWEKGAFQNAKELSSMITNCGSCIVNCVGDESCRECLGKLAAIDTRDQVASYKTIVSYESDRLRGFSFCILQKHNVFECRADIPQLPVVAPLSMWRNQALDETTARGLLVGHLQDATALTGSSKLNLSWKVALGANVAYDQFPSQNQLFYPAAAGKDMWYDPVFRVETLDGRNVWCKRHYKVRPATKAGTFHLSVLDNGVTSNEFWTIVGCADDLSWIVFHYAGAASAVGQRYLGGLLCTADGSLPNEDILPEIWKCFRTAGIEPWELYTVDNDETSDGAKEAGHPPLDFYRSKVLARRSTAAAAL